jgi:hypothetical protein
MNVRHIAWAAVVAVIPQLALAGTSKEDLGALQAVHDFCTTIDPSHAEEYEKQADALFAGLTPKQISEIRGSSPYKGAYQALAMVLPELPQDAATVHACTAILVKPRASLMTPPSRR